MLFLNLLRVLIRYITIMNTLTQQEIDTLPAPPQEWLDALYPKYDMLPTEIWNKIYEMKNGKLTLDEKK